MIHKQEAAETAYMLDREMKSHGKFQMWKHPTSDLVTTEPLWRKLRIHQTFDENLVDVQDAETSEHLEKITAAMNAVYRTLKRCSHMWNVTTLE